MTHQVEYRLVDLVVICLYTVNVYIFAMYILIIRVIRENMYIVNIVLIS